MRIYGIDFTGAPRAAKPITLAAALLKKNVLRVERLPTFAGFEALLASPGTLGRGLRLSLQPAGVFGTLAFTLYCDRG